MDNAEQITAFVAGINAAMEKLQRMAQEMEDHLSIGPDDVTWADVGMINKINADLQDVVDFTFQEGEYAK